MTDKKAGGCEMYDVELEREVLQLIGTKREGEYWDFKQSHHANKVDLLHDIICMANNRADRDSYIIYGVTNEGEVVDGISDDSNRKNQQKIIDFLKDIKFINGVRPTVDLKTLIIKEATIDVLVVRNSTDTPYFLLEDYPKHDRRVRANYIYSRVGDTNTPIDRSADINHIEYLWKKRFLLTRSPLEQVKRKLQNINKWEKSEDDALYYVNNPEYTVTSVFEDDYGNSPFYSYLMSDSSTTHGTLAINYYGTKLYSKGVVMLDGGRYITVVPGWGFLRTDEYGVRDIPYRYFVKGSLDYNLHKFLKAEGEEAEYAERRLYKGVLLFLSELEQSMFEAFVLERNSDMWQEIDSEDSSGEFLEIEEDLERKHNNQWLKTAKKLISMLEDFRIR